MKKEERVQLYKETVQEAREGMDIFVKAFFSRTLAGILIALVLFGGIGIVAKGCSVNADRIIFKNSIAYNETMASFLSQSLREYNAAESQEEKAMIMNYVAERYPNIDYTKIENQSLRAFYINCINGGK